MNQNTIDALNASFIPSTVKFNANGVATVKFNLPEKAQKSLESPEKDWPADEEPMRIKFIGANAAFTAGQSHWRDTVVSLFVGIGFSDYLASPERSKLKNKAMAIKKEMVAKFERWVKHSESVDSWDRVYARLRTLFHDLEWIEGSRSTSAEAKARKEATEKAAKEAKGNADLIKQLTGTDDAKAQARVLRALAALLSE